MITGATTEQLRLMVDFLRDANEVKPRHIERLQDGGRSRALGRRERICGRLGMVAGRRRLPDLPALVPGLRRRRGRRPARRDRRLDHLEWLGVDALWLSPIYPSPLADSGTTSPTTPRSTRSTGGSPTSTSSSPSPTTWPPGAARSGRVTHLDRAPLVSRAPRLVRVGRRGPAEQLARCLGRAGLEPRRAAGAGTCTRSTSEQPDLDWRIWRRAPRSDR